MVTQADIDAANLWMKQAIADGMIRRGNENDLPTRKAFAAHAAQARKEGIELGRAQMQEEAAKVADNRAKASQTAIHHMPDENKSYLRGSLIASEQIADAIRSIEL